MYTLRFWFEHGGGCLWSSNDAAREKYGYKVDYKTLPITEELKMKLATLEEEYRTFLDWDDPAAGCQWSPEQKRDFLQRARVVYSALCANLGDDYLVVDELNTCM